MIVKISSLLIDANLPGLENFPFEYMDKVNENNENEEIIANFKVLSQKIPYLKRLSYDIESDKLVNEQLNLKELYEFRI